MFCSTHFILLSECHDQNNHVEQTLNKDFNLNFSVDHKKLYMGMIWYNFSKKQTKKLSSSRKDRNQTNVSIPLFCSSLWFLSIRFTLTIVPRKSRSSAAYDVDPDGQVRYRRF